MPVPDIKVGDKVWAGDLGTGTNELRTVTGLLHKQADEVMTITVADGAMVAVTEEHPFYVAGLGWVISGDLRAGDELAQRDGGSIAITSINVRRADTTVYNFEVAGDHNYYVTEEQLLSTIARSRPRSSDRRRIRPPHPSNDPRCLPVSKSGSRGRRSSIRLVTGESRSRWRTEAGRASIPQP